MTERLYEALEVCLKALETGADLESVSKLFPEMQSDLLPLLEASRQAWMLAIPEVPDKVLRRSKARVLQHAAGMREASARYRKRRVIFAFPRLAISLAIALLFLLSGSGLVRASNGSLPGDNLYPVKRTWEDVRLLLILNPESREALESEFEKERLHEVDELLAEGRHEEITFAGVVTDQNGNVWIVSGVPVQITADSRLPVTPVTVGTSVMLQGRTNAKGLVEAEFIEVLGSNIVLPTSVPTEVETGEDNSNDDHSGSEVNENDHQDENESNSSSGEDHDNSGSEYQEESDASDNTGSNSNDNDNTNDDNSHSNDEGDNSGPGGRGDEGDNESYD